MECGEIFMQQTIQFETVVESGVIRIPKQYVHTIPAAVKVTLAPVSGPRVMIGKKSSAGALSSDDFSALAIDTRGWAFDREDANERR
jgi:hypothetical protein